jgi:hypothetical protein
MSDPKLEDVTTESIESESVVEPDSAIEAEVELFEISGPLDTLPVNEATGESVENSVLPDNEIKEPGDLEALEVNRAELLIKKLALEADVISQDEKIKEFETRNIELVSWSERNQKSFAWRVFSRLQGELASVASTIERYSEIVNSLEIPEIGLLAKARKKFHRRLLLSLFFIGIGVIIMLNLPTIVGYLSKLEFLSDLSSWTSFPTRGEIFLYATVFFLIFLIGNLIRYYRAWSEFVRKVTLILAELELVTRNTAHCRAEKSRLDGLYPQVKDWLEILGSSVNTPWLIRHEWLSAKKENLALDHSPFSLRIAQAEENDVEAARALRRDAIEQHLRPGWRREVFNTQVEAIRKILGLPVGRLDVEILDRDISYSPAGPRSLVKRYISEESQLFNVAKSQLIPLMSKVQTESITAARPPVTENRDNPLECFFEDDMGLSDDAKHKWDEFLSLAIGAEGKSNTPLSVLTFSSSGRQAGHADSFETILYGPDRIISKVTASGVLADSYSATAKLPMDIVVRIDLVGPVSKSDLLITQDSAVELARRDSKYEQEVQDQISNWRSGT